MKMYCIFIKVFSTFFVLILGRY